ncbi:transcriptional regulator protein [Rutstroemia sp. NJR-2017a BBW]|nr:transcriptional regulator protein [Rutstroemia sp. NJR-2017a BBW]
MGHTGEDGRPSEWKLLKKSIIGIEIDVERLEGKFKMSQEMGKADREGVVQGFANLDSDAAQYVSQTVKERSDLKDS